MSLQLIDDLLNKVTMYRLVVYVLSALAAIAILFAHFGRFAGRPESMILSLVVILASAYGTDRSFARLFSVPSNRESWLITGLIIFLIVPAGNNKAAYVALALAGALSSASKFLLARHGKHFFNPAAFAAAFLSTWGFWPATWWIGSSKFWPFSLLLGLLVVRKMRRFSLFATFVVISLVLQAVLLLHGHQALATGMKQAVLASPLIFLSTIMLTEPATMPPRRNLQLVFAALVATLYVTGWKIGPLIIVPEVALLFGNVFAYLVSPKFRVRLVLKGVHKISERVHDYVFTPDMPFSFVPGQYMEWTLAGVPYDSRGNRRTFTIASSPTETEVRLGLKYYEPASTYKTTFYDLRPGDIVYASQLAGNFTLHEPGKKKLAFIAGGIGITPFRSMVTYLADNDITCDIVLLYFVSDPQEFAYLQALKQAAKIGIKTIPIVTDRSKHAPGTVSAKLSSNLFTRAIPDYRERTFYISGPNHFVDTAKNYLRDVGVASRHIKTDHFSGY